MQFTNLLVSHTMFSHTLKTAVVLNAGTEYDTTVFTSTQTVKDSAAYGTSRFTGCFFTRCTSDKSGGGIRFGKYDTKVNKMVLEISTCGFRNCESGDSGGAFYSEGGTFEIERSCIDSCRASSCSAFFELATSTCDAREIYVTNIAEQTSGGVCRFEGEKHRVKKFNISKISASSAKGAIDTSTEQIEITEMYITMCKMAVVMNVADEPDLIRYVNFVKNKGKESLIYVENSGVIFSECTFIKDESKKFVNMYTTFRNCIFSDPADPAMFPNVYTPSCKFGAGWKTKNFDLFGSKLCWQLSSETPSKKPSKAPSEDEEDPWMDEGDEDGSTAGVAVGVMAIIVVVGVVGFFAIRCLKGRGADQGKLLSMYAQV